MVFSENQIEVLGDGILTQLSTYSGQSSIILNCIREASTNEYRNIEITLLIDTLNSFVHKNEFVNEIEKKFPSLKNKIECSEFYNVFFDYYFERLPFMFVRNYKGYGIPGFEEFEFLIRVICNKIHDGDIKEYSNKIANCFDEMMSNYKLQNSRFKMLSSKLVKNDDVDGIIYDSSKIWDEYFDLKFWNDFSGSEKIFSQYVIEAFFPMFWDTFVGEYERKMLGFFTLVK